MEPASDALLRTLAAVPPGSRVLDLGCGSGRHTVPLLRLGFEVHACDADERAVASLREAVASGDGIAPGAAGRVIPVSRPGALGYPDAYFDWVVAYGAIDGLSSRDEIVETLREARRVLAPGGWIFVAVRAVPADFNPLTDEAEYASDSGPAFAHTADTLTALMADAGFELAREPQRIDAAPPVLEGIYRRVDPGTVR